MQSRHEEFEKLIESLNDEATLQAYKEPLDGYRPGLLPRLLGGVLVWCGNLVYGEPSYLKFRAVEVIARVPYHSWSSAAFTLLTLFYADETRALKLSTISRFARFASDNETMHVVVISALARKEQPAGVIRHTLIPMFFAFFYFWMSYLIYLINPRWSFETNYIFEQHAFDQYSLFLKDNEAMLKSKPIESEFLAWYGRHPRSQYEFFQSVRNDEIVHRNQSIHEIGFHEQA
ncbi:MAG: alternative oxidase [Minisyncoccota bacterium]